MDRAWSLLALISPPAPFLFLLEREAAGFEVMCTRLKDAELLSNS